jgi:prepilin-type processing-associated H-X9-DG protein
MLEIQDSTGRLIVAVSMRIRHAGKPTYVFVDGRKVAEFATMGEAARHARSIAEGGWVERSIRDVD